MGFGKSNMTFAFIWMVLLGLGLRESEAALKTSFLEDLCYYQKKVKIDLLQQPTGILMSLPGADAEGTFECEVVLSPPRDSSVVLSIYRYDVTKDDELTIEDSDRFKISLTNFGNFKDEKKSVISEGRMVIRYRREAGLAGHVRQGFQFTFTAAKKEGRCYDNEFKCNNRLCILKEYVCDGHNHCGDGSDQKTCVPKDKTISNDNRNSFTSRGSGSNVVWISIIGVAGGILFIIVVVFIVVVVRIRKQKAPPATNNNRTGGGSDPLQSVSSTVPAGGTVPSAPPAPEEFSFYNRVRRSLKGLRNPKPEEVPKEVGNTEVYQVPSMYPNLGQSEPVSEVGGIVNSEFKREES